MADVTSHDIEASGVKFILEWTHSDEGTGHISITEACEDEPCEWFLNDSKPVKRWSCNTHMYEGDENETELTAHPTQCDFKDKDEDGDCTTDHETHDFTEYAGDAHFSAVLAKNNIAKELASAEPNIKYILHELKDIEKYTGMINQPSVEDSFNNA